MEDGISKELIVDKLQRRFNPGEEMGLEYYNKYSGKEVIQ